MARDRGRGRNWRKCWAPDWARKRCFGGMRNTLEKESRPGNCRGMRDGRRASPLAARRLSGKSVRRSRTGCTWLFRLAPTGAGPSRRSRVLTALFPPQKTGSSGKFMSASQPIVLIVPAEAQRRGEGVGMSNLHSKFRVALYWFVVWFFQNLLCAPAPLREKN